MGSTSSVELTPEMAELQAATLHRAVEKGIEKDDISAFYYPIHSGADVNRRNQDGVTLLEMGIELQRVAIVGFLASFPETDKTLKTSKGMDPLERAKEIRSKLEAEGAHEDKILGADAIVDVIANERSARLFRAGYDLHIDKMLAKQQLERQRMFGLYFIAVVVVLHVVGFMQPGSETNELLQISPIFHLMNGTHRLFKAQLMRGLAMLGFGDKDEL